MHYAATIGFFDGVHVGHQYLLSSLKEEAANRGLQSAIITFNQHPQQVLRGETPSLLTTFNERITRLRFTGVDKVISFDFERIHTMSADEFAQLLHDRYDVDMLIMGYDHHFGCTTLNSTLSTLNSELEVVRLNELPGEQHISSTQIRKALLEGRIVEANEMLGYAYSFLGKVVHGKGLGRTIGFPTANLQIESDKLIPAPGVYWAEWGERRVLLNINDTLEMYVPHFEGDLYDQTIVVELIARIREEKHFDTLDELKTQIQKDLLSL